jgi:uridylate kinase
MLLRGFCKSLSEDFEGLGESMKHFRILIKLSGELLRSSPEETLSADAIQKVAQVLSLAHSDGIEFGVVIGAGNLYRGLNSEKMGFDRVVGDQIGMLGTVMNALAVSEVLKDLGVNSHVMAPQGISTGVMPMNAMRARELISKKEPVFFAGGTGNPFFTTDSAATLRALEIEASLLVKSTKVAGVYSEDPVQVPEAIRYETLTYQEVLQKKLRIMDQTSIALAMEYGLSIFVYKFGSPLSIKDALESKGAGTYIQVE